MYLEISARRTGKTKRLEQKVRHRLSQGHNCIIIYPRMAWAHAICSTYLLNHEHVIVTSMELMNFKKPHIIKDYLDNYMWFFDEFDLIPKNNNIPILQKGYYVTTPRFLRDIEHILSWKEGLRDDRLLDLLEFNNGKYEAHAWLPNQDMDSITDMKKMLPIETFNHEFGNGLFTAER